MPIPTGGVRSPYVHLGCVNTVLTVVLRYGAAQRQRFGLRRPSGEVPQEAEEGSPEDKEVEAMVAGVKTHGVSVFLVVVSSYRAWLLIMVLHRAGSC